MTSYLDFMKQKWREEAKEHRRQERIFRKQLESHAETDLISDRIIADLIYLWTTKGKVGQHAALNKTPKGRHWSKILAEESRDYMKEIAFRMTDSDLIVRLEDMRILENLIDKFRDILYEIQEGRKKTASLGSV